MCIYDALKYKYAPFIRKKYVVPKPQTLKNEVVENYKFMNGKAASWVNLFCKKI